MKQNRWRSKVMWATAASLVVGTLVTVGVITPTESETINQVIGTVLNLAALFGIVNDPTTRGQL
ncbi:MAG: holin [Ignavibacteria bacterium]|jgi:uncharacterized membrane protein|nr:holin [Ignavibacteria bacterium]